MSGVRTCLGCRKRQPIEELLGVIPGRWSQGMAQEPWQLVRVGTRRVSSSKSPSSGAELKQGPDLKEESVLLSECHALAQSMTVARGQPGKGLWLCPEVLCRERGWLAVHKAQLGQLKGAVRPAAQAGARALAQEAGDVIRQWLVARRRGLTRRRLIDNAFAEGQSREGQPGVAQPDATSEIAAAIGDAHSQKWQDLVARLEASAPGRHERA